MMTRIRLVEARSRRSFVMEASVTDRVSSVLDRIRDVNDLATERVLRLVDEDGEECNPVRPVWLYLPSRLTARYDHEKVFYWSAYKRRRSPVADEEPEGAGDSLSDTEYGEAGASIDGTTAEIKDKEGIPPESSDDVIADSTKSIEALAGAYTESINALAGAIHVLSQRKYDRERAEDSLRDGGVVEMLKTIKHEFETKKSELVTAERETLPDGS